MRAIRIADPGSASVVETADPTPRPGEVIVHVRYAGLCATDRKLWARGASPHRIPGHEVAGVLHDGQPVVVHPDTGCGHCKWCNIGWQNRCSERQAIGLQRDGGLADLVVVPSAHVVPLEGLDLAFGPFLEPLACGVHAIERLRVTEKEPAFVVGAGAMGILSMWALQAAGARVVVGQSSAPRRELARHLGADVVCDRDTDPAAALGERPRVAVVSAPGTEALQWALDTVDIGGRVHAFAGTPGGAPIDANIVHYNHLDLVGSTGSGVRDVVRARELVRTGAVPVDRMPVEWVDIDEVSEALSRAPGEPALKTLVRWEPS